MRPRRRAQHIRKILTALPVAVALLVTGCGSGTSTGPAAGASSAPADAATQAIRDKHRLPQPFAFKQGAGTDLLPEYVASAEGMFAAYNLDVTLVPAKVGGVAWIPLLASGEIDATAGAGVSAPIISRGNGAKVIAVSAGFITSATFHNFEFWAVKGTGIRTPQDLVGKRVAIANSGSTVEIGLDSWLRKGGVNPTSVTKVVVPYANMPTALASNQIDVAGVTGVVMDPWVRANPDRAAKFEVAFRDSDVLPSDKLFTGYTMREQFVSDHPDVVSAWIAAMTEASVWMNKHPQEAAAIAVKAGAIPSVDNVQIPAYPAGLCIDETQSKTWLDLLESAGQVKPGVVGTSDWYTNKLNPAGCP